MEFPKAEDLKAECEAIAKTRSAKRMARVAEEIRETAAMGRRSLSVDPPLQKDEVAFLVRQGFKVEQPEDEPDRIEW